MRLWYSLELEKYLLPSLCLTAPLSLCLSTTAAFSVDRLLLVICNQSDTGVGGTLSEPLFSFLLVWKMIQPKNRDTKWVRVLWSITPLLPNELSMLALTLHKRRSRSAERHRERRFLWYHIPAVNTLTVMRPLLFNVDLLVCCFKLVVHLVGVMSFSTTMVSIVSILIIKSKPPQSLTVPAWKVIPVIFLELCVKEA